MAKVLLFVALCVLPALVSATRMVKNPLVVQGLVYCDRCRAGFETPKSRCIPGATVKLMCSDRKTGKVVYEKEGYTDEAGKYEIAVPEDHWDQICDALLVKSSQPDCAIMTEGRERARVILTTYNGITSNIRYANAMGFMADEPEAGCAEMMKMYQEDEEDV
ncbi:putative phosphoglycerate mutase [Hibiscus syriacus]|uniref:Phosphoglycerate mutase n=1 Tax=Hibiscus syriacus TaxID=106335 RepID=A0A6A3BE84_HIBSY|nr:major pollen allergen Lol p 11-like [Hibiscus syriacus]KAE8714357.1 putative phosphoglycerate mutase [Hibiscus syriacus]